MLLTIEAIHYTLYFDNYNQDSQSYPSGVICGFQLDFLSRLNASINQTYVIDTCIIHVSRFLLKTHNLSSLLWCSTSWAMKPLGRRNHRTCVLVYKCNRFDCLRNKHWTKIRILYMHEGNLLDRANFCTHFIHFPLYPLPDIWENVILV